MRTSPLPLLIALFVLTIPPSMIADNQSKTPQPSKPTNIWLLQNVDNHVQLGLEVSGRFSYPFTFTASPKPTSGIGISRYGLISGTPSSGSEQKIVVTVKDNTGKLIGSYPIVLRVTDAQPVTLGSGTARQAVPPAKKDQSGAQAPILLNPVYEGGDTVSGKVLTSGGGASDSQSGTPNKGNKTSAQGSAQQKQVKAQSNGTSKAAPPPAFVTITCKPGSYGSARETGCSSKSKAEVAVDAKNRTFSYQFHASLYRCDRIFVTAGTAKPAEMLVQTRPRLLGEQMRAILGWQQAGASSVDSQDNVFFNFYISRPLAFWRKTEGDNIKWRWWGNVQVASYPQPGNQTIAQAVANLPVLLGSVKLNQLAEGAEFQTGIEWDPLRSFPFRGLSENTRQIFTLGFIADFGATGFLSSPSREAQVFVVPAPGSPQFDTFHHNYPDVTSANVAFISPDYEQFPKQYWAGIRLTTHYVDPSGAPLTTPAAMVSFSVGQNQVVTGGTWHGAVGRIEAFYPLPFGNRGQSFLGTLSSLYLFGQAQMRLGGMQTAPPLELQPAAAGVALYDPSVTLVTLPSTRDVYRLGFGMDLVRAIAAWTGGSAPKNTTTANPPSAKEPPSSN